MKEPYFVLDHQKKLEKEEKKRAKQIKTPVKPTRRSTRITAGKF